MANGDRLTGSPDAELAAVLRNNVVGGKNSAGLRHAFSKNARELVDAAVARAHFVLDGSDAEPLMAAAEALAAVAIDFGWAAVDVDRLVELAAAEAGIPPVDARRRIFLFATQNPRVLELPPRFAMEFQLNVLAEFAGVSGVTLWTGSRSSRVECILAVHNPALTRRVRAVARATLSPEADHDLDSGLICGIRVLRWQRPCGALVIRRAAGNDAAVALARETAAALAPILERDMLLERSVRRERLLVEATEKRLARIGYDIHDGPLQDATAMLTGVHLARRRLHRELDAESARVADVQLQNVETYATEVMTSLRELAVALEPTHVLEMPFASVVRQEIDAFARRTDVDAALDVVGDFDDLTASQRLALYRVIQEALTNVREHSGATIVHVSLEARRSSTELRVIDNGSGFEVTRVLIDGARRGRLGLVGIGERVRMLGGTFDIISRAGKYTELYVSLPVWRPAAATAVDNRSAV